MQEEAFVAVLACVRAADGRFPDAERELLHVLCRHHFVTRNLSEDEYLEIVGKIKLAIDKSGWRSVLRDYLSRLSGDLRYPLLMCAADLALIDLNVDDSETECLQMIGDHFQIDAKNVGKIINLFKEKNGITLSSTS